MSSILSAALFALLGSPLLPAAASAQAQPTDLPRRSVELELSVGAIDHPVHAFSRISALTVDDEGRMYVVQPIEGQVTVLNPDGACTTALDGRAGGPASS